MGQITYSLSKISKEYNLWIVCISHNYGTDAEKVLDELFQRIASDIGPNAEIVRMVDEGALEAERKFNIPETTRRPVLIITQVHPNDWKAVNDECLVISLGSISDEDVLRDFLFKLSRMISRQDFSSAKWSWRKQRVDEFVNSYGSALGGIVSLIGGIVSS